MKCLKLPDIWLNAPSVQINDYPHLKQIICELKKYVADIAEFDYSTFQLNSVPGSRIYLTCPVTGNLCEPIRAVITRDKTIFIEYSGEPKFWLLLSNLSRGYPPSAIYYNGADELIKFDDQVWGIREEHLAEFKRGLAELEAQAPYDQFNEDVIVTGDQNFAHFLWNQLPALIRSLEAPQLSNAKVVVTHEPLLPLQFLIPELSESNIIRMSPLDLLDSLNKKKSYLINPGSIKISQKILKKVKQSCADHASHEALEIGRCIDASNAPVIWISVRSHDRTAHNQVEVIKKLILEIYNKYDSFNILIDGFSLPYDLETNYDYSLHLKDNAKITREMADEIILELAPFFNSNSEKKIFNVCGFKVHDSLYLSQRANFYFCHHGTVQHKVGWMANCYGIVHSNSTVIGYKPEYWASSMIENGVSPAYISKQFVLDFTEKDNDNDQIKDLRLENYIFVNIDQLISEIMVHLDIGLNKSNIN